MLIRHFQSLQNQVMVSFLGCQELSKELPGAEWTGQLIQIASCPKQPNLQLCGPEAHTARFVPTHHGNSVRLGFDVLHSWVQSWLCCAQRPSGVSLVWTSVSSSVKCRFALVRSPDVPKLKTQQRVCSTERSQPVLEESSLGLTDDSTLPRGNTGFGACWVFSQLLDFSF